MHADCPGELKATAAGRIRVSTLWSWNCVVARVAVTVMVV